MQLVFFEGGPSKNTSSISHMVVGGANDGTSKPQSVKFDLPLSDSVRGKSTLDDLIVAFVQMIMVRRRFGGSTKRVKTFVAPMGMKAP